MYKVNRLFTAVLWVIVTVESVWASGLPTGMKLVDIPGGTFEMISIGETVTIDDFAISETEVTWGQYYEFLNAKQPGPVLRKKWIKLIGEEESSHISKSGKTYEVDEGWANHPAVNVSKAGAKAFCSYYGLRLPKESEWEYAFGGPEHFEYPWGGEFDDTKLCFKGNRGDGNPKTMPVKSFSSNGYGLYDVAGNVWEWCAGLDLVLRGGSWNESSYQYTSGGFGGILHGCPGCPHPGGGPFIGFRPAEDSRL